MDSGVAVIELEGAITLGDGSSLLRDTIEAAVALGHKSILLDFEGVGYIDSAGLGELVGSNQSAKAAGANIKLVHLQKKVKGLLQITKLITMFESFEDESVAVKSFLGARSAQV
jgi:anti-sigma B factor antagonist